MAPLRTTLAALPAAVVLLASLGVLTLPAPHAAAAVVDPALKACVNAKLALAADADPTPAQLATITDLSCSGRGIAKLDGIETLPNLTKLFVSNNKITDVAPLGHVPGLFSIGLDGNQVADITPLGNLAKLTNLNVAKNRLSDLSVLKKFLPGLSITSNLQAADGGWAPAGQAVPVPVVLDKTGAKANLTATPAGVTVSNGQVTYPADGTYTWSFKDTALTFNGTITVTVGGPSPSPTPRPTYTPQPIPTPTPTPTPERTITIADDGFRACVGAAVGRPEATAFDAVELAALRELSCVGKGIVSVAGAEHLTGLAKLVLSTNSIVDVSPLAGLANVTELYLAGNKVDDPSSLRTMTALRTLVLPNNAITDLAVVRPLTQVEVLDVSANPIASLEPLAGMTNLRDLNVSQRRKADGVGIDSLAGLESLTGLTRLVANNNQVSDLAPVAGLAKLEGLFLNANDVASLEPLRGLDRLTRLNLPYNKVSDVAPLAGHTTLVSIDLSSNRIADLSAIGALPNLGWMGFAARYQQAELAPVPAQMAVSAPQPRDHDGTPATVTPPAGVEVVDGRVTYPAPGTYTWTFDVAEFGGTVTQVVTDAVAGAAHIPDPALRACLADAAGLPAGSLPTTADVARITALDCRGRGITDLTGLELATSLRTLVLADNRPASLAPIERLPLASLDLSRTGLIDGAALGGLTGVDRLIVDGNQIADLSALAGVADTLVARDQAVALPPITGDAPARVPGVVDATGRTVAAVGTPAGATVADGLVTYARAGAYAWPFASPDGTFTGTITQPVTRDRVDTSVHDGAQACIAAGNVWVVVERDTGLTDGGCATTFATGLEALASAGFAVEAGGGFVNRIDGYPGSVDPGAAYWSYWLADPANGGAWGYASQGASSYRPEPGTLQGWRFATFAPGDFAGPPAWVWSAPSSPASLFHSTAPTRLLDTRQQSFRLESRQELAVPVATGAPVPAGARAVSLQVTVTGTSVPGFVSAWPTGSQRSAASTLNAERTDRANHAIVTLGDGGKVSFWNNSSEPVDLILDVTGWFEAAAPTPGAFLPQAPMRALDTRVPLGTDLQGPIAPGGSRRVKVAEPGAASAVVANVTATGATAPGHLRAWSGTGALPDISTVNFVAGQDRANLAIIPVAADGTVAIHNRSSGSVHAVVDVAGTFLPGEATAAGSYVPATAQRLLETRESYGGSGPLVGMGATRPVDVAGRPGIGTAGEVGAVVLNLTAVDAEAAGTGVLTPLGVTGLATSSVNFVAGSTVANLAITQTAGQAGVLLHSGAPDATHYVLDVQGWFRA